MRLWHEELLSRLPRAQLLGQHRECCALRGKGWGRKHQTVNYVFDYPREYLAAYHQLVMAEMERRGYHPDPAWKDPGYCGQFLPPVAWSDSRWPHHHPIYPEHNAQYKEECRLNLAAKGITIA
ncbi:MAG: DNA lyase [Sulfobacillus thermosulfidooxidans]|uniref:DNA lyase n=1 Tax=Sulfobacillus thermotolerans TaxID=338644 RepID=A0ABM6RU93_9FIRM|nr:TIGR02328 family protein [Sulfobacillus sp. hq2]AUW94868.1 DNA lyase [Sulfobacillus thermotolerans]MCY0906761.1 TIGR02328 family protein [Sulfobacillus thermotolerans]POB09867.1 DNA lyase [Sulfobacillus sp. hq2]PSR36154.1 MAG: DNA lyase [Sulfobacillus thermosulfidooxidans]